MINRKYMKSTNMLVNITLPNCGIEELCNKNFKIRIDGLGHHQFCTYSGLVSVVGLSFAKRLVRDAYFYALDEWKRKLRRGIKITFVSI